MEFLPQIVKGCYLVALEPRRDERGFFARAFSADEFESAGLSPNVSQINISRSESSATVRGIHWQVEPHSEAKLVRCVSGIVFDVCVDVRLESPTFGRWVGAELSADNHLAMYVPPGCGHAHQTLQDNSTIMYSTSAPYAPESEFGARWDDPAFSIDWPLRDGLVISDKDRRWPDFAGRCST